MTATGTVEPVTQVEVGTQVSGIIDKLYADYNDQVKAGQLIAEMDKVTLQAELESAQAQLASSKTEYEYQTKNYARTKTLHEKQLVSDAGVRSGFYLYETARNAYEQSSGGNGQGKAQPGLCDHHLADRRRGHQPCRRRGPDGGCRIRNPDALHHRQRLDTDAGRGRCGQADIGQVADGQRVQFSVDAYPDDTFEDGPPGTARSHDRIERGHLRSGHRRPNPDLKLKPGLTANVTIFTLEKDDATAVPTKALRFVPNAELLGEIGLTAVETDSQAAPGSRELWVKEGTTPAPRRVYAGAASGDMTEITEGLTGSEEIVTGLVTAKPREETAAIERSPFMPGPPGSNDKRKIANDDERGHPIGQHTTGFRRRRRGGARTARNFADDHRRSS